MRPALIEDLSQITEKVRHSTVTVQVEGSGRGAGSGVIWRADGAYRGKRTEHECVR